MLDLGRIWVCISQDGPGWDLLTLACEHPWLALKVWLTWMHANFYIWFPIFSWGWKSTFRNAKSRQKSSYYDPSLLGFTERYAIIFMDDSHHYNKFFVIFKRELILDARSRAYDTMYLRPSPIWFSIWMLSCKNLGHNIRGPIAQIFHLLMRYDIN